jgi:hypothetical protein
MNEIEEVFDIVNKHRTDCGLDVLLIGGFAVNYYGYTRNTLDVDFMIAAPQASSCSRLMKAAGFTNVSDHHNVLFFNRPGSTLRVDFLKVDEATMSNLSRDAIEVEYMGQRIMLPSLNDLLGMKIFALAQGKMKRVGKDLPDIVMLSVINELDYEAVLLPLCQKYGSVDLYDRIVMEIREVIQ